MATGVQAGEARREEGGGKGQETWRPEVEQA